MSQSLGPAEQRAFDSIEAQARRTAAAILKHRARAFAKRPMALETLYPGLAAATPETVIAIAQHLLERERRAPQRWFGFGGDVGAFNAKAALLYGRALRMRSRTASAD
ncbi:MAG TPA: hypothetical protein VGG12_09240 [Methylovirgula sp.]|jgi:hypothetical protein